MPYVSFDVIIPLSTEEGVGVLLLPASHGIGLLTMGVGLWFACDKRMKKKKGGEGQMQMPQCTHVSLFFFFLLREGKSC